MDKAQYKAYQEKVHKETSGYNHFCTGGASSCIICNPEGLDGDTYNAHNENEGSFSSCPCELCNSHLGGDRHAAHGIEGPAHNFNVIHYDICVDCLYYIEYGQLDDMTMMDMES